MRRNAIIVAAAAVLALPLWNARAQAPRQRQVPANTAPPAAPAVAPPQETAAQKAAKMKKLLVHWERQSAMLKTLDVTIKRIDKAEAWNVDDVYEGRAILKAPNLAFLDFKKIVVEKGKTKREPAEQIRCTGSEVWQYKFAEKQLFIYPLDREQRKRALEEGPLPFLFNMKAAEAEARYTMRLLDENAAAYMISVTPKLAIDMESFSKAYIQLDRARLLPTRIYLVHPNGKDTRDYQLSEIRANEPVNDLNFQGASPRGWRVERPSLADGAGAAGNARQPAARTGAASNRR